MRTEAEHAGRLRGEGSRRQSLGAAASWLRARPPAARHLAALALYVGAMLALFGGRILPFMTHRFLAGGNGDDAEIFAWSLQWWPHAIGNAVNPLLTSVVWAPTGFNLADATTIPTASILLSPVTLWAGRVATFNLLVLLGPTLSA